MIRKFLIVISLVFFGFLLFFIVAGIFSSSTYQGSMTKEYPYPIDSVWHVLSDRSLQMNWRKDIIKQNVTPAGWVEYLSEKDSMEFRYVKMKAPEYMLFSSRSRKYELVAAFGVRLSKLDDGHTRVNIIEHSKNFNKYASVYFMLTNKDIDLMLEHQNLEAGLKWKYGGSSAVASNP